MITRNDKIIFGLIIVAAIAVFLYLRLGKSANGAASDEIVKESKGGKKGKKKDKNNNNAAGDSRIAIVQKWDMPSELKEISGIAYISDNSFACVQDEEGKIFIYNTANNSIEKEIPFSGKGDYEGISIVGSTAYVLRADGHIYEVQGYNSAKPIVKEHDTHLDKKQDVEGLCYDDKNNRLLLAIKGKDPTSKDYKGIYAFDLTSKKLSTEPVQKVATATVGDGTEAGKIKPSDIDLHPGTGDIYIVDGPASQLFVFGSDGAEKGAYQLNTSDFPQPEGVSFNQAGDLFISNEGVTGAGNILKVTIAANQ